MSRKIPLFDRNGFALFCRHHSDFDPAQYSRKIFLCSAHFEESCFTKRFAGDLEGFDSGETKRFLSRKSVPTIDVAGTASMAEKKQISAREKRMVCTNENIFVFIGWNSWKYKYNEYTYIHSFIKKSLTISYFLIVYIAYQNSNKRLHLPIGNLL